MALWCQDEAGPYQAIPQPGATWHPAGHPYPPAARVRARRNGQVADAVSPGDRRRAGPRRALAPPMPCSIRGSKTRSARCSPSWRRTAAGARALAGGPPAGAHLGALVVVVRTTQASSGPPAARDLGQSERSSELRPGALAAPTRYLAALHAVLGLLAEHGRVAAAHPLAPRPFGPASRTRRATHRLVGPNGRGLEPPPHALRVEWHTPAATGTRPPPRLGGSGAAVRMATQLPRDPLQSRAVRPAKPSAAKSTLAGGAEARDGVRELRTGPRRPRPRSFAHTSSPVTTLPIATSASRPNASMPSTTPTSSSATRSASTSSGCATRASKAPTLCPRPRSSRRVSLDDLRAALEQFAAIADDLGASAEVGEE